MNKTTNYQLNQWERADRVLMEDFNADNAKIDAAIKAVDSRVDGSATQAALNALSQTVAGKARVAAGTYTGDGAETRVISVGFTPKAVFVRPIDGDSRSDFYRYGGLAVTGSPAANSGTAYIEIISGGFRLTQIYKDGVHLQPNYIEKTYNYIAIG